MIKEELGSSKFTPLFLVCFGVVLACLQLQINPSDPATPSDNLLLESRSNLDQELTIWKVQVYPEGHTKLGWFVIKHRNWVHA